MVGVARARRNDRCVPIPWQNGDGAIMTIDDDMLALARDKLYSAVISDTLDSFGLLD